jgi:hypothetical protein
MPAARIDLYSARSRSFRPVRERLGARTLQSVSKADVENLVDWMLTSGRRRGGKAGTGLGPRSVRLSLGRLKAAFEMAVDEGRLVRNVVKLVTPPEYTPGERATWSRTEVRRFLRVATTDRLHAAWRLSLCGLRRDLPLPRRGVGSELPTPHEDEV